MKLSKLFIVLLLTVGCFKTKRSSFDPSTPVGTLNALFRVLNSSSDYELEPVLTYSSSSYTYYTRIEFETPATVSNVKSCSVSPSLPAGIILDTTNCKISGTPTSASSAVNYTVTAKNITKTKTAVLSISVEK
ncbi:MAG TPA: putative Ig domain-containing protein, partial [Leptospiraceae bacterium]|nr:putative Ig domain-containing protein [Leptospiraceae bacterium]